MSTKLKTIIKKACVLMTTLALFVMGSPVNAVVAEGNQSKSQETSVVIYLDGQICSLSEFINIRQQLSDCGISLISIIEPGIMHAFSNEEKLSKEYSVK